MPQLELRIFSDAIENTDGIFYAKKHSEVAYPESGNEHCLQIEENSFWFKHRNQCIIEAVKKYAPDNVFFDIGGGNGYVAKGLEDNGIETVLVEPGFQGARNAQKRKLKNIICSTLEDAQFKEDSISVIGLFDVVEHIKDDVGFLSKVFNYLTDQGLVFITVPAYQALWSDDDIYAEHFRRYTTSELEGKLNKIGFYIEYSTYLFSILPIPVLLFRSIPSRMGWNKRSNDPSKYIDEHRTRKGIASKVLDKIWKIELNKIKNGKAIPFGGSCFVIARKKGTQL